LSSRIDDRTAKKDREASSSRNAPSPGALSNPGPSPRGEAGDKALAKVLLEVEAAKDRLKAMENIIATHTREFVAQNGVVLGIAEDLCQVKSALQEPK